MKKTYIAPASHIVALQTEQMMASSITYDEGKSGNQNLSNKKGGWNSDMWTETDSEE